MNKISLKRKATSSLIEWKNRANRRPLIVRGARQTGKTFLIRQFAEREFDNIVEFNFDLEPEKVKIFNQPDIDEIIQLIAIDKKSALIPGKSLLFLDEIQAVPSLISKLRYFYEHKPDLHVIAAGSLLDFALEEHEFSMPVGRIEYLFIGPMSFEEFLAANNETQLIEYINNYSIDKPLHESIHQKCLKYLRRYYFAGGMPKPVTAYIEGDYDAVEFEKRIIMQTFADDFSKYKRRINISRMQTVFNKIPQLIGRIIKYVNISPDETAKNLKEVLYMLSMARVVQMIPHSSANGLPLEAELKPKIFKTIFLDIGLVLSALKYNAASLELLDDAFMVNKGALAEQFIGQHLMCHRLPYEEPSLHFWNRNKNGTSSEVDYVIAHKNQIVPVEVKAGKTGTLKSQQVFVSLKKSKLAVRFNADVPSLIHTKTSIPSIQNRDFTFLSLPMYLVDELPRILDEVIAE